jgi:hypothetical protein
LAGKTQARPRRRHLPRLLQIVGITEHKQSLIVKAKAIRVAVAIITVELFRFMTTPVLGRADAFAGSSAPMNYHARSQLASAKCHETVINLSQSEALAKRKKPLFFKGTGGSSSAGFHRRPAIR